MKSISLVVAVVAVLAIVQTGTVVARDGDRGGRMSGQQRDAVERSDRGGRRDVANRVDSRQDRQWSRIRAGRESGALTRGETRMLRKDQKEISRMERRFERDGRLDKRERRILNRAQNRASDRIYRAKHNDRERGYRPGWGWGDRNHRHYKPYRKPHHHRRHHGHNHYSSVEERVIYAPSSSSSLALDLQFDGFSVGMSKTREF
ncbi:MAG: hypothetical protein KDI63_00800 [Gammaproteobacteria bacterium]|nr:hypothetical protein [Gammaproteobacteria bacterium]